MILRNQLKLKNQAIPATITNSICAGNISLPILEFAIPKKKFTV
jgi:hypothetical protein